MPKEQREFDIIVWGATGFTGALVAEYLFERYGHDQEIRWALGGRNLDKLEAVREGCGMPSTMALLVADASDSASLQGLVERTKVILTTVGPYQLYGNELVAACAVAGTDYVDLCGEPLWMRTMIDAHTKTAQASGARIVFSCGFDSIPFDLGVYYLQQLAREKFGAPLVRVKGRVLAIQGTFSGGTAASFKATMAAVGKDPGLFRLLVDSFALTPAFIGASQPAGTKPEYDSDVNSWVAPFVMATINTKNVHRSNLLLGHQYGKDFVYDEMVVTGPGDQGEIAAKKIAEDRSMALSDRQPGEGPSKEERDNGFFDLLFIGEGAKGESLRVRVQGDKDPGYGSTSKMISECAVCLVKNPSVASGGIWTTAPAMGSLLIDRLEKNAGLTFKVEDV